jgi:sulfur carrier protein ThiS
MTHAAGSFSVKSWDESTYQELADDAKLTKATVAFALEGDLTAAATWDAVMCYRPDGTAVYTGMQQMTGTLAGREGTFVLQADGEFVDGEARSRWQVVPGSGTGGLAGLTGSGTSVATQNPTGAWELDYTLA